MVLVLTAAWFVLVVLLSHAVTRVVAGATDGLVFRVLIFPGVLVHELSHYALCKLTGAPVARVKLFEKRTMPDGREVYGGYVMHGRSRLPLVGDLLIAFAPVFGCLGVIVALTYAAGDPLGLTDRLTNQPPESAPTASVLDTARVVAWQTVRVIGGLPGHFADHAAEWTFWVYLYLCVSLAVALAPSRQDFANSGRHLGRNALWAVLAAAVVYAVVWLIGPLIDRTLAPPLAGLFALTLSVLAVALVVAWVATRLVLLCRSGSATTVSAFRSVRPWRPSR
jgi:hypothetical protein